VQSFEASQHKSVVPEQLKVSGMLAPIIEHERLFSPLSSPQQRSLGDDQASPPRFQLLAPPVIALQAAE
jgi:hypothetical protein